jgi:hypothetical protein
MAADRRLSIGCGAGFANDRIGAAVALAGGVTPALPLDAHGTALGHAVLEMPI